MQARTQTCAARSWHRAPSFTALHSLKAQHPVRCRAATDSKLLVRQLLDGGHSFYSPSPSMNSAIEELIQSNPCLTPGTAITEGMGVGTWQVFWAPHISSMSSAMQTKFEPILYKFAEDGGLVSNVKYSNAWIGQGWLSASGRMFPKDDTTVEISFDKFWVDVGEEALRETQGEERDNMDAIINNLGRATFFPALALFPVKYLDEDLAVFEFPPLRSKIAITRLSPTAVPNTSTV